MTEETQTMPNGNEDMTPATENTPTSTDTPNTDMPAPSEPMQEANS